MTDYWYYNVVVEDEDGRKSIYSITSASQYSTKTYLESISRAYWKLGESTGSRIDSTTNGNNLTDNNSVSQSSGKLGNAAHFTASAAQYLSLAGGSAGDIEFADENFTIDGWIYLNDLDNNGIFFQKNNGDEYELYFFQVYGTIEWRINNQTIYAGRNKYSPATGSWIYFVVDHDADNNKISVQFDMGTKYTSSVSGGITYSGGSFGIGGTHAGVYLNGRVDDVGVYPVVLSTVHRNWRYNNGNGRQLF